jgi:all-trans-8'-apo-beta-carotenal 15,15'-oxygenase
MMSRRNFMTTSSAGAAGLAFGLNIGSVGAGTPLSADTKWLTALGTSLKTEQNYTPRIEGNLPADLTGKLFRNGPGLFERAGYRKEHLLDGDGMIQSFEFADGRVQYRNRFVRTEKFVEEEAAGELLYPTWTTRAPGSVFSNIGGEMKSQAGVTTLIRDGKLLALDEVIPPLRA